MPRNEDIKKLNVYLVTSCPFGEMERRARLAIKGSSGRQRIIWGTIKDVPNKTFTSDQERSEAARRIFKEHHESDCMGGSTWMALNDPVKWNRFWSSNTEFFGPCRDLWQLQWVIYKTFATSSAVRIAQTLSRVFPNAPRSLTYVCIQGGGRGCAWERDQFHGLQQKGYLDMEDVSTPEVPNFSIPSRAMNFPTIEAWEAFVEDNSNFF